MNCDLNDVRHFLAVARNGSTLAAAKALGVNQTTCARRIAAFEEAIGLKLFERGSSGYRITPSGAALVAHAERIEAASSLMQQAAQDLMREAQAEIRFSTSDVLADLIAGPAIASFAREHPDVRVTLHVASRAVDLSKNEADVALRAAPILNDPQLVVRKVMETPWAFYRSTKWPPERGAPETLNDLARYPLGTLEGRPSEMLRRAIPGVNIRYVSNSMKALVEVIKAGECVGALPMLVGEQQSELTRCFALDLDAGGLWVLFHERLRHAAHIRSFVDHLSRFIEISRRGVGKNPSELASAGGDR